MIYACINTLCGILLSNSNNEKKNKREKRKIFYFSRLIGFELNAL